MMAFPSDVPTFPDLKCALDYSPSALWSLKHWGERSEKLGRMISSLKDSFTNYHTTGKAHSEASIALGQTLSQAATLFGDSHGGASELLTKAADCFNRIECYRDMMLLNQTTTMTAQSLEQIARDFEQTRALGRLLHDSQLTLHANWDKFAACRHVSHLQDPSQLNRLARDTFDSKFRYELMLANYTDALKKTLTEKKLVVLQKVLDHMLAQYSFFNFGYQILHDMEPLINDLFREFQTQMTDLGDELKSDHAERLRISHEIKQAYETDLIAYPLHLNSDSLLSVGQLKSSGSYSRSSGSQLKSSGGPSGSDVSTTMQNLTGNIKQGLHKLFHLPGSKKASSPAVSEYEIINSPTRQSATPPPPTVRTVGQDELPVDSESTAKSAGNSPLLFRCRTNPLRKSSERPRLKASTIEITTQSSSQSNEGSMDASLENVHNIVERVHPEDETSGQLPVSTEPAGEVSEGGLDGNSLTLGGCGSSKSQEVAVIAGIQDETARGPDSDEPRDEEEDTRKDDLSTPDDALEPSDETPGDANAIVPLPAVSSDKQQDTGGEFSMEQNGEQSPRTQDTERGPQTVQEDSKPTSNKETRVLKQGYLRLSHRVQGRSKWPVVYCSVVLRNDSWLMMAQSDGRTDPVELDNLLLCAVKPCPPSEVDRNYCFQLISPRTERYFQAFTATSMQEWMDALQEAITSAIGSRQFRLQPSQQSEARNLVKNASERIHAVAGNDTCADCQADDPEWASINLGVVICIECSGVHRSLGVHISKVRSLLLDSWDEESVQFMESHGNARSNAYYEAKLGREPFDKLPRPTASTNTYERQAFIRMKYIDHSFTDDPVDVIDPNETVGSSGVRRTSSTSGQSQKDISQTKVVRRKEVGRQFSNRLLNVLGDSNSLMDVEKELLWDEFEETDFGDRQQSFSGSKLMVRVSSQEELNDSQGASPAATD